ncbi:Transposase (plasmid) [Sinorhizobium sp. CCBAU 05631]|nr:Transposase [Sinorhizobium sp. CCBAU 05631]
MRDLVRARLAAVRSLRQARQQLSGFLLRHGCHYGRPAWTQMHRRWLAGLRFTQPAHHIVLEDHIATIEAATDRRDRLTKQIEIMLSDWSLAPVVQALQSLRGMALVTAATMIAELGDISRFTNPRQLMAYLGLVPSEHSSGATRRQGGKSGERNRTPHVDRGGLELPVSRKGEPRAIAAPGAASKNDPRYGVESAGAALRPLSQAHQGRKAGHDGNHGDRARIIGLRLGDCMPGLTALNIAKS